MMEAVERQTTASIAAMIVSLTRPAPQDRGGVAPDSGVCFNLDLYMVPHENYRQLLIYSLEWHPKA